MLMAAFAALGGVGSTYINMIGDFFQSLLGFAGTTQWAAGLHVIWIIIASLLVGKPGAATTTGVLKGFVELFSGNTHGLLVMIIDISTGLIVDLFFILNPDRKRTNLLFYLAAGFSSAINVIIFQFFAAIPEDLLTVTAILAASSVSFISGVVFAGFMTRTIISGLKKTGLIKDLIWIEKKQRKFWPYLILAVGFGTAAIFGWIYFSNMAETERIEISGDVEREIVFPDDIKDISLVQAEAEMNGFTREYEGFPLKEIVNKAGPTHQEGYLLITADDGYSFFITLEEVAENENLILSEQKAGGATVYNVVGAESTKAWVRGVKKMTVIGTSGLQIYWENGEEYLFNPEDFQTLMDSALLDLDGEKAKLQGVPLIDILQTSGEKNPNALIHFSSSDDTYQIQIAELEMFKSNIRIFINFTGVDFEFVLAKMDGGVLLRNVNRIDIR